MKSHKLTALLLALLLLVPFTTSDAYASTLDQQVLKEIKEVIAERYVDEIVIDELNGNTPEEVFQQLDQHSSYYSPQVFSSMMERLSGEYVGIGVYTHEVDGKFFITDTIEDSPSWKAGIKSGDEIISVDGENVEGWTSQQVAERVRGPEGTKVNLVIKRIGQEKMLKFTLTRAYITVKTVNYEVINDIGYLNITQFNENTYKNTVKALGEFRKKNIDKVIIDVRDNPGGILDEVVMIARLFVKRGPIIHIEYKNETVTHMSYLSKPFFNNVVVLTNEDSASASEVLAASIQDSKTGVVVGKKTYGKGSVQRVYPLRNGGGFKLTEARYLSPNKRIIDGVGVKPNYEVERLPHHVDLDNLVNAMIVEDLYMGAESSNVWAYQQRLKSIGYTITDEAGYLGLSTMEALKTFAKDEKLPEPVALSTNLQKTIINVFWQRINSTEYDKQLNFAIDYLNNIKVQNISK